jgi:hypothetical protein
MHLAHRGAPLSHLILRFVHCRQLSYRIARICLRPTGERRIDPRLAAGKNESRSRYQSERRSGDQEEQSWNNVLGKRAGHASELVRILPILPLIINYTTKLEDIGKKQVVLQTTELNTMSNFTTSTTP